MRNLHFVMRNTRIDLNRKAKVEHAGKYLEPISLVPHFAFLNQNAFDPTSSCLNYNFGVDPEQKCHQDICTAEPRRDMKYLSRSFQFEVDFIPAQPPFWGLVVRFIALESSSGSTEEIDVIPWGSPLLSG